jgi:hypothetical protein
LVQLLAGEADDALDVFGGEFIRGGHRDNPSAFCGGGEEREEFTTKATETGGIRKKRKN